MQHLKLIETVKKCSSRSMISLEIMYPIIFILKRQFRILFFKPIVIFLCYLIIKKVSSNLQTLIFNCSLENVTKLQNNFDLYWENHTK